jgi:hypothetical protein
MHIWYKSCFHSLHIWLVVRKLSQHSLLFHQNTDDDSCSHNRQAYNLVNCINSIAKEHNQKDSGLQRMSKVRIDSINLDSFQICSIISIIFYIFCIKYVSYLIRHQDLFPQLKHGNTQNKHSDYE